MVSKMAGRKGRKEMSVCITLPNKPRKDGYVRICINYKQYYAHRYYYEEFYGKLHNGLEIDHLCENRACINIEHLRPSTHAENMSHAKTRTHHNGYCRNGHDLSISGVYNHPTTGATCRKCKREALRNWRKRLVVAL